MNAVIIDLILEFSYLALFLLIAIENIFPPIPSEIILTAAGFLCALGYMHPVLTIVCATLGSLCGALMLYLIGRRFNRVSLHQFLTTKGRWTHIKPAHAEKALDIFQKYGRSSVFFLRFIPIVRSLISIPAGMNQMPLSIFLFFSSISTLIWNTLIVIVGIIAKEHYVTVANTISSQSHMLLIACMLLACIGFLFYMFYHRRKKA